MGCGVAAADDGAGASRSTPPKTAAALVGSSLCARAPPWLLLPPGPVDNHAPNESLRGGRQVGSLSVGMVAMVRPSSRGRGPPPSPRRRLDPVPAPDRSPSTARRARGARHGWLPSACGRPVTIRPTTPPRQRHVLPSVHPAPERLPLPAASADGGAPPPSPGRTRQSPTEAMAAVIDMPLHLVGNRKPRRLPDSTGECRGEGRRGGGRRSSQSGHPIHCRAWEGSRRRGRPRRNPTSTLSSPAPAPLPSFPSAAPLLVRTSCPQPASQSVSPSARPPLRHSVQPAWPPESAGRQLLHRPPDDLPSSIRPLARPRARQLARPQTIGPCPAGASFPTRLPRQ